MLRRLCLLPLSRQGLCVAAVLLTISLTSCGKTGMPANSSVNPAASLPQAASAQTGSSAAARTPRRIILPNPALVGCKSGTCTQVLPDKIADADAIFPWQVWVDFNGGDVIGLIAFYDQPTSIDDLQAAVDERYGKWAAASSRTGPVRIWRVEPEKIAIQLSVADSGMVQLIYLTFAAKHPASDQAREYQACVMEKSAKCAAPGRWTSWAPDFLR
jgi:hypothetical protein